MFEKTRRAINHLLVENEDLEFSELFVHVRVQNMSVR